MVCEISGNPPTMFDTVQDKIDIFGTTVPHILLLFLNIDINLHL